MSQSVLECKACGGRLDILPGSHIAFCLYCGAANTVPKSEKANLYNRANYLRRNNEFDKAMDAYGDILKEYPTEAEAYWGIVLCKYGVEYVEDPKYGKRVPTCHRTQYDSVMIDSDYLQAVECSDGETRALYVKEAEQVDKIQKGILELSAKEEPFDVFICYKESGDDGARTEDSVLAQEIYFELIKRGYKVFFARKTLEGRLGSAYEPIIFAALSSAKVMIVLGTKAENYNSVWVKNEWSRFRARIKKGENKTIIPAYKNMSPYDLPAEFSNLQSLDMGKLGFIQDLLDGIDKMVRNLGGARLQPAQQHVQVQAPMQAANYESLLKRAHIFLEDGDFASASKYFNTVLDMKPEDDRGYLGMLLVGLGLKKEEMLPRHHTDLTRYDNFNKALRFAGEERKAHYLEYNRIILKKLEKDQLRKARIAEEERLERERLDAMDRQIKQRIDDQEKKRRAKNRIVNIVVVLAVLIIAAAAFFVLLSTQPGIEKTGANPTWKTGY